MYRQIPGKWLQVQHVGSVLVAVQYQQTVQSRLARRSLQVFLPRDAMRKRAVFAVARCLSVCHVMHCIQTAEDNVKLLSRPGSPVILVLILSADTQFHGRI